MIPLSTINTTDKAKKKIKSIAKNNNLDFDLVYYILSFYWNYDGYEGDWVRNILEDTEYKKRCDFICDKLNINPEIIDKAKIIAELEKSIQQFDNENLTSRFLYGSVNKNNCFVSEYASFHYLSNFNTEKLNSLEWKDIQYNIDSIIKNLFFKIFRAGAVDRYNLEYLYADLVIEMPYISYTSDVKDWTKDFIYDIESSKQISLSDLRTELKKYCKGDKYFLQTVLEALSYANILRVKGHSVKNIFIPDFRNNLSEHYYSNEWSYPLRFWNSI